MQKLTTSIIIIIFLFSVFPYAEAGENNLETRIYVINDQEFDQSNLDTIKKDIKKYCQPCEGAVLKYAESINVLAVTNTPANLTVIENRLPKYIDSDFSQVYIEAAFIKIPEIELRKYTDWSVLNPEKKISKTDYQKILQSEKTEILSSIAILTNNQEEATIRAVSEKYFPETWSEPQNIIIGLNPEKKEEKDNIPEEKEQVAEKDKTQKSKDDVKKDDYSIFTDKAAIKIELEKGDRATLPPIPEFGETTELGSRLTVNPNIQDEDITLDLVPVLQLQTGWTDFSRQNYKMKMPVVAAISLTTTPTIKNGEAMIIGGNALTIASDRDKDEHILLLLTCSIVDPDGKQANSEKVKTKYLFRKIYSGKPFNIDFNPVLRKLSENINFKSEKITQKDLTADDEILKSILEKSLMFQQPQINIETTYIKISSTDLAKITGRRNQVGLPSPDLYKKIIQSGKGEILGNPKVISKNGEESSFRMVKEEYLPDAWETSVIDSRDNILYYRDAAPEPGDGIDTGVSLTATPSVSIIGNIINLSLNPSVTKVTGFDKYPFALTINAKGKQEKRQNLIIMPVTIRKDIMSNVKIENSATLCIGKAIESEYDSSGKKSSNVIYIFVTANVVGSDGQKK